MFIRLRLFNDDFFWFIQQQEMSSLTQDISQSIISEVSQWMIDWDASCLFSDIGMQTHRVS
jgi:hypothetical protein